MSEGTPQADWYPDPGGSGSERYWDGERWTDQTRTAGSGPGPAPTSAFGDPSPLGAQSAFGTPPPAPASSWQQPPPVSYQPVSRGLVSPKSPGLAIALTILWLGAGHFYAGRSDTTAILLAVGNAVLWALFLFCLVGILGWIPLVIWASIDARSSAIAYNRRHGLPT